MVMWILIGFYAVVMALAAWERNWWRSLYYFAAILISLAVMGMTTEGQWSAVRSPQPVARHPDLRLSDLATLNQRS